MKKLLKILAVTGCITLLPASYAGAEGMTEIHSLCELHGEYTDTVNNTMNYSFDLPKVEGSSEYITQINDEIGLIYNRIEHCLGQMETGVSIDLYDVNWISAKRSGITSIMITENYGSDDINYHFFNYDEAGSQAANEEVLAAAGLTTDEFVNRAYDIIDRFMTREDMEEKPEFKKMWDAAREETLSPDNVNEQLPMFLAEDGTIIFCARCNTVAGSGWHNHLFALCGEGGFSQETQTYLQSIRCIPEETASDKAPVLSDVIEIHTVNCEYEMRPQMQSVIYRLEIALTNNSDQEIMEIKYQIRFLDQEGHELYSGWDVYNGQDTPVKPGETVIAEASARLEIEEEPASCEEKVLEVYTSEELPPIHLPQEGELLIRALSDEHMEHLAENPPVKIRMWIDRMGDLSEAEITDEKTIQEIIEAFSVIKIGKETWEVVTDNYNGLIFTFEDGTEVGISLNLKNLEYSIYHSCQYNELEDFEEFWSLMRNLTE